MLIDALFKMSYTSGCQFILKLRNREIVEGFSFKMLNYLRLFVCASLASARSEMREVIFNVICKCVVNLITLLFLIVKC